MPIQSELNHIFVVGKYDADSHLRLLSSMHNLTEKNGFSDLELDFSKCERAFPKEMVGLCAASQKYWKNEIDIRLKLPEDRKLRNLFNNANWAYLIDPHSYDESRYLGYTHARTMQFKNDIEQHRTVNIIMDIILSAIRNLKRDDLKAIEWSINEITDNVINHSNSQVGGFVQVSNYSQRKQIEFVVSDAGIGIPDSLRTSRPKLDDTAALDEAIREGVTRDNAVGQGNGLYGSWRISQQGDGEFSILSNFAQLIANDHVGLKIATNRMPYKGTTVSCRIGYDRAIDIGEALKFAGKAHVPIDYVELHFDTDNEGRPIFKLAKESVGFGSRKSGDAVRRKLENIIEMSEGKSVIVDMTGVPLTSSSYADEVFGKLFVNLGPMQFAQKIRLKFVDDTVRGLIDKSILQRMKQ